MDFKQLKHFIAVVEYGSFSKAAQATHITQSALSRSIQTLEQSVGEQLLDREWSHVVPTAMGDLLLKHAGLIQAQVLDMQRDLASAQDLALGYLTIGVGPFIGAALVGSVLGRMHQLYPRLRLKAVITPWQELPERLRAREFDLIVLGLSQTRDLQDIDYIELSEYASVTICRAEHPLTRIPNPTVEDVLQYPLAGPSLPISIKSAILPKKNQLMPASSIIGEHEICNVECDSSALLKEVLRMSDAISMMPEFVVEHELASGHLVSIPSIDWGIRSTLGVAWLNKRTPSRAAELLIQLLQDRDQVIRS